MKEKNKEFLLEEVTKLRDFNINCIPNEELAKYYQTWIDQVLEEDIIDDRLRLWLNAHAEYWRPKDREYSKWVFSLIGEE